MRSCPTCGRTYSPDNIYCHDDGSVLTEHAAFSTPTQVIKPPPSPQVTRSGSPLVYILVGAMAMAIVGLSTAMYFVYRDTSPKQETVTAATPGLAKPPAMVQADNAVPNDNVPEITERQARDLIERWRASQNDHRFDQYKQLYHSTFVGYKDTPDDPQERQNVNEWMRDRRAMVPNFIDVQVIDQSVVIDGSIAVVRFTQRWRSARSCDVGEKEITIQMFPAGPRIRSEVLRNSRACF